MGVKVLPVIVMLGALLALGITSARADQLNLVTNLTLTDLNANFTPLFGGTNVNHVGTSNPQPINAQLYLPAADYTTVTGTTPTGSPPTYSSLVMLPSATGAFEFDYNGTPNFTTYTTSSGSLGYVGNIQIDANGITLKPNSEIYLSGLNTNYNFLAIQEDASGNVTLLQHEDGNQDYNFSVAGNYLNGLTVFNASGVAPQVPEPSGIIAILGMAAIGGVGMVGRVWRGRRAT
jgi:hypothetical protein